MMVFSVFDSKAEQYLQPFFAPTEAAAVRALMGAVQDPNHEFHRFAEDYALFNIGLWDPEKGDLAGSMARSIVGCWTLKASLKPNGNLKEA